MRTATATATGPLTRTATATTIGPHELQLDFLRELQL